MMFDVAVIGGGLAGCNAAIHLAQQGHRVVLLEAGRYPRAKVCGEFLSPECLALAAEAGFLNALQAIRPAAINTIQISASHGQAWRTTLPAPAWGLSRWALDKALVDHANSVGVCIHTRCAVRQIEGSLQQGFALTTSATSTTSTTSTTATDSPQTIHARTVIAAHGRHSTFKVALKKSGERERASTNAPSLYIGLKQHFAGPSLGNHLDLHVFQGGYCGMSQIEDGHTNVCLMVQQAQFQRIAGQGKRGIGPFIAWLRQQSAPLDRWLAQATPIYSDWLTIANVSLASKPTVQHEILYAGDAAGMIAPLAGDGMAMALHSGKLAAQAIHQYLVRAHTASAMCHAYTQAWQNTFAMRLRLGRLLQSILLYPRLLAPSLALINRVPVMGDWLIQHTRDLGLLKTMP